MNPCNNDNRTYENDLKLSTDIFERYIKEPLEKALGGRIEGAETKKDAISKLLDEQCGIDYAIKDNKTGQVRGIANRINVKPFPTFTIRYSKDSGVQTEYEKRRIAIYGCFYFPHWTVQEFVTDSVIKIAYIPTKVLYKYIEEHINDEKCVGRGRTSNADFLWVFWDKVGAKVITIDRT